MAAPTKLGFRISPLTGRTRFKLRNLNNILFGIFIFTLFAVPAAFLFSSHMGYVWLADIVIIAILYYVFVMFLDKRAIKICCPNCFKYIRSNTPWICGACQAKNEHAEDFPFLYKCEACGAEPKAYQCHHYTEGRTLCGRLIFLTEDELMHNYAVCLNRTEKEIEQTSFEKEDRRLNYRLHLAELTTKVTRAEKELTSIEKGAETPEEKIRNHRAKRRAKTVSAAEIYREERKANEEKYKNDPDFLKKLNEDLDDWYNAGDWERII